MRNLACTVGVIGVVTILLVLLRSATAWSQWPANGVALCTATYYQFYPTIVSDGSGGAIVTWSDSRSETYDIYAQRVDGFGRPLWTANGVALCTATGDQTWPTIVSDGAGGAIITWWDTRSGNWNIYAQRVSASGAVQWMADGVALCTATGDQQYPKITSDGAGGAIVTWDDGRSVSNWDIYAQRVNASGTVQWMANGVALCTVTGNQVSPTITSDGAGGAIVTWSDYRSVSNWDIYAQRVNASGAIQWATDGVALCTATGDQQYPTITSDGAGGAIVTWDDGRSWPYSDIYAQRVTVWGSVLWTTDGVALCTATGKQQYPQITSDGASGAIVTWYDNRSGTDDIYAQGVNALGAVEWPANGVAVCTATGDQDLPQIISDGGGGAIVTWNDYRSDYGDVYVQRVDASGSVRWKANGLALCTAAGAQVYPTIGSDCAGGAIVTWHDDRGPGYTDIYAQRIDRNGYWGYPSPLITAVADVPSDQGGFVNLSWNSSRLDPLPDALISRYTLWRAISHPSAERLSENGAVVLEKLSEIDRVLDGATGPVIRVERVGAYSYYWELLSSVSATHASSYSQAAPTLFDGYGAISGLHYFQVVAHATDPDQYWISPPDSGRSLDNLAPLTPTGLAGEQKFSPPGISLTWNANAEADLRDYAVYRGTSPNFIPSGSNRIATPTGPAYLDNGWTGSEVYYYKVSARDIHMNESAFALLSPDQITAVETPKVPEATYLAQNFPNPFNPMTRIEFGLKEGARVSLRIYDTGGRLVRVLVDDERRAGRYQETWDGLDSSGRTVSSGIYFYRLSAGTFEKSRKMALMR